MKASLYFTLLAIKLVLEVGFEPTFDMAYKATATEILRTVLATREYFLNLDPGAGFEPTFTQSKCADLPLVDPGI